MTFVSNGTADPARRTRRCHELKRCAAQTAGGLGDRRPSGRLLGQVLEHPAALALPEDPDRQARDERARNRDQDDPVQRCARGKDPAADDDAAPGADVAHAVRPAGAERAHPGREYVGHVSVQIPQEHDDADVHDDVQRDHGRGAVHVIQAEPAAGEDDGSGEHGGPALDPVPDQRVERVNAGRDQAGPAVSAKTKLAL